MNFLPTDILDYAMEHTTPEDGVLSSLNQETTEKIFLSGMLSGHLEGRFLSFLSRIIKPKRILDIGTYTGYSALCLAEGLTEDGHLTTIEYNQELESIITKYIQASDFSDKISVVFGDATKVISEIEETFDLVFIDADKKNYLNYYKMVKPLLSDKGIIVVDNVLWEGKVTKKDINDKETTAIKEFNEYVKKDKNMFHLLLPLRDGIMLIMKK